MDPRTSPIRLRLQRVRDTLVQLGVSAVLVPSSDPHLSEYLPGRWQGREWLSGFTGSMGTLVVTTQRAALFADSRYWVQAEAELAGTGIDLVRIPTGGAVHHIDWLARELPRGSTLAVDGKVLGIAAAQALHAGLDKAGVSLRTDVDVFDTAWPDRPGLPTAPIYEHAAPQAPLPRADKLRQVREAMATHGDDALAQTRPELPRIGIGRDHHLFGVQRVIQDPAPVTPVQRSHRRLCIQDGPRLDRRTCQATRVGERVEVAAAPVQRGCTIQ